MKIHLMGTELFLAYGQTNMTTVDFFLRMRLKLTERNENVS